MAALLGGGSSGIVDNKRDPGDDIVRMLKLKYVPVEITIFEELCIINDSVDEHEHII